LFKEYEVKVHVRNVNETSKLLKKEAILLKRVVQLDIYYDYMKKLFSKDEHLRLRIEYEADNKQVRYIEFTWKGPRQGRNIEIRRDISVQVLPNDLKNLKRILEKLGFKPLVIIRKLRERYKMNNIELEFDKQVELIKNGNKSIPLGSFLQASIETYMQKNHKTIKNKLWKYLHKLGFKHNDWIEKSYIELAIEKLEK